MKSYVSAAKNWVTDSKRVIYIQPFGNMRPQVEELINQDSSYLQTFFQLKVVVLPRLSYSSFDTLDIKTRIISDADFQRAKSMKGEIEDFHDQIQARSFMNEYLLKNKPDDAIAFLGVTEHDIYNPNYKFLFGSSNRNKGIGVVSLFRLIDYRENTRNNMRKVISKQITNMFSIKNVNDYKCLLNFHTSKRALEKGEFKISPHALEKLQYNIGFSHSKRFKQLDTLWREENSRLAHYYQSCGQLTDSIMALSQP